MARQTYQGFYKPKYPQKYRGDCTQIVYRSRWEFCFMTFADNTPEIVEWESEGTIVPYKNPLTGRTHRYFPDFVIKKANADGTVEKIMIEIKPFKETSPPDRAKGMTKAGKPSKRYVTEATTYMKNDAKWQAARAYCAARGWRFVIMTEYELGLAKRPKAS